MNNSKCDCGAVKTHGENTTLHSDWCSAIKPDPDLEPDTSGYLWMSGASYVDELQEIQRQIGEAYIILQNIDRDSEGSLNIIEYIGEPPDTSSVDPATKKRIDDTIKEYIHNLDLQSLLPDAVKLLEELDKVKAK